MTMLLPGRALCELPQDLSTLPYYGTTNQALKEGNRISALLRIREVVYGHVVAQSYFWITENMHRLTITSCTAPLGYVQGYLT